MRLRRDAKIQFLRRVPLFERCSQRELQQIAAIAKEAEYPEGRTLVREGAPGSDFFVVLAGEVDVRRKGRKLRTLRRGDFFGEIALLARSRRTATVTTGTPVEALVVPGRDFKQLLKRVPTLQLKVLEELAERLATTNIT